MISQEKVEARTNRVSRLVLSFESQIVREVDSSVADVSSHLVKTLSTRRGVVAQSPENVEKILALEDVFQHSLNSSSYYPTILAFVESFVDQVDEFKALQASSLLSTSTIAEGDRDILAGQGATAAAVIGGHSAQVCNELRQFLGRSLGALRLSELVDGACAIVRKVSRVGPIARDQLDLWFRLYCSLIYRRIEERGTRLSYSYAGPVTKATRDFCSKLLAGGSLHLDEISALDNGQTSDAFLNGGGYGCNHFWLGEVS